MIQPNSSQTQPSRKTGSLARRLVCSSCHQEADFIYSGEQQWPESIAKRLNMPAKVSLWRCSCCNTTITRTD